MICKVYYGERVDGVCHVQMQRYGRLKPLPLCLNVRNHSPTGFEWGYCGSGPAQLALAILTNYAGSETALLYYQAFKRQVVSKWKGDRWEYLGQEIHDWIVAEKIRRLERDCTEDR